MGDNRGAIGAYDDEPTAEELAFLASDEANAAVPPAEDDDGNPVTPEAAAAEKGVDTQGNPLPKPAASAAAPAAALAAAPVDPAAAAAPAPAAPADKAFADFLEQHKGKSPEEIARLAFQQQQRANQAGFQARQNKEQLDAIRERGQQAIERVRAAREKAEADAAAFNQKLQDDPDAATREIHERLTRQDTERLNAEELAARREVVVSTISAAIPTFDMDATRAFGAEMNYSAAELDNVTDPRDLATLHFASLSGRLIAAGVIDMQGNIIGKPAAVAADHPALGGATPALTTLSSAPARQHNGGDTIDAQLTNIINMSEEQLDAFEKANPGVLTELLKKAG